MATSTAQQIATVPVWDYLMNPGDAALTNPRGLQGKRVKITLTYDLAQSGSPVTLLGTDPVFATTDPNGFWQANLIPNNKISPGGTLYAVNIEGYRTYLIKVTDVNVPGIGWQSVAIAVLPPITGGAGYTLPGGTTVLGALNVNGNALFGGTDPWVDPLSPLYGGVGNGLVDDTQHLISAVAALPLVGATLYLAPGTTWLISSEVLFNLLVNCTVIAYGASLKLATTAAWGTTQHYGFKFQDCTNPKVLGLTLDGNGAALKALPTVGWFLGIAFTSSFVLTSDVTVKSFNCWLEDCQLNNIRSFGVGFRLTDGCHVNRCRGMGMYNDAASGLWSGFVVGARVSNFNVSSDCDFDGTGSSSANSVAGVVVSPGNVAGANLFDAAMNGADILNYLQPAFFTAPTAAQATSTVVVAYGAIADPVTAPVTADGGVGALPAGTYQITYTLLNLVGETKASNASIGLVLGANRQIAVTSIAGLPNGVYAIKVYITAPGGQAGFVLQVPVVANATGAFNVNNVGNGVTSPAANSTAPAESNTQAVGAGGPNYLLNDWFFLCQTPGVGANNGVIPADSIKVTAVDQVNKLVTFQRYDGTEGAGAPMNWAGQKVWTYSIATRKFCRDVNVSDSSFKNFGVTGLGGAGGAALFGVLDFSIDNNRGWNIGDIIFDVEHGMRGAISDNQGDNPGNNSVVAILFFIRDVKVSDNILGRATGGAGVLFYSGWAIASNIDIDGNVLTGSNIFTRPQSGSTWDNVVDGLRITDNEVQTSSNLGGVISNATASVIVGRNASQATDLGGYVRDVTIDGNRFDGPAQRIIQHAGIDGLTITDNEASSSGYEFDIDENTLMQSKRMFIDGNILNNIGYRYYAGEFLYRSSVAPTDPPRIGGRNQWRNTDSTLDGTQGWYAPAGVAGHPTGPAYNLIGTTWLRTNGGVLQGSQDSTNGVDGAWRPFANLTDAQTWLAAQVMPQIQVSSTDGGFHVLINDTGHTAGIKFTSVDGNKYLRINFQQLEVLNSAGSLSILKLQDAGSLQILGQFYPADQALAYQSTGGILHSTGVPSNANGNNNDFCISDNNNIYVRVTGVWVVVSHTANTAQTQPGNPAGTANATDTMMGLAGSITPASSGKVLVILSGDMLNNTLNDGASVQLRYGTGGAPSNGNAATGTAVGGKPKATSALASEAHPFSVQAIISGLSIGTAYWLDAAVAAITGGTASIENLSLSAMEV